MAKCIRLNPVARKWILWRGSLMRWRFRILLDAFLAWCGSYGVTCCFDIFIFMTCCFNILIFRRSAVQIWRVMAGGPAKAEGELYRRWEIAAHPANAEAELCRRWEIAARPAKTEAELCRRWEIAARPAKAEAEL